MKIKVKNPFRLKGWWGHDENNRFVYDKSKKFKAINGAEGWQLSNAPVIGMAAHKASLDIFSHAGITNLFEKSKNLVSALEYVLINFNNNSNYKI